MDKFFNLLNTPGKFLMTVGVVILLASLGIGVDMFGLGSVVTEGYEIYGIIAGIVLAVFGALLSAYLGRDKR